MLIEIDTENKEVEIEPGYSIQEIIENLEVFLGPDWKQFKVFLKEPEPKVEYIPYPQPYTQPNPLITQPQIIYDTSTGTSTTTDENVIGFKFPKHDDRSNKN